MPATSQRVGWVRRIQALLPAIQRVAMPWMAGSSASRTPRNGSTSLSSASANSGVHQNRVFSASNRAAMTPRRTGGRKLSMTARILPQLTAAAHAQSGRHA